MHQKQTAWKIENCRKKCSRKYLQAYLRLLSVPRSQYGRKWLLISTANRYQPLSVYDWDAAKALRVGWVLLAASSMGGKQHSSRQRWRTLLTSAAAFNRYLSERERDFKKSWLYWAAARRASECFRCFETELLYDLLPTRSMPDINPIAFRTVQDDSHFYIQRSTCSCMIILI